MRFRGKSVKQEGMHPAAESPGFQDAGFQKGAASDSMSAVELFLRCRIVSTVR